MEPQLDDLHHVAIQVKNIQRAVEWYRNNFATRVDYQDESWALLRFGNIYLALVKPEQHPPHIAIEHQHAERFGNLTQHRDGTQSVYIADSEGNNVEIMRTSANE
jgi:catechol 2,3-dioxygenase-like lactoylglutathione lyase family enzyme